MKEGRIFWTDKKEMIEMRLQKVDEHLKEKLKDPYFKELYELEEQKLKIVKRII